VSVRLPLVFVLGIATALLVACGGSNKKLLPEVSADRIKNDLADIRQALDQQDCDKAGAGLTVLRRDLQRIPPTVDRRLRERLGEGADKLGQRVPTDCQQQPETTTETVPTETTTTPPTDTTTAPPTDTTTAPPTDTTTVPPTGTVTTPPTDTSGNGGTPPETTP
jgi:hypothetical protein